MKLYTEEQVRKAIELSLLNAKLFIHKGLNDDKYFPTVDEGINTITPIELPSDGEVEDAALFVYSDYPSESKEDCDRDVNAHKKRRAFNMGAHWTLNQIRRQDNG